MWNNQNNTNTQTTLWESQQQDETKHKSLNSNQGNLKGESGLFLTLC